MKRELTAIPVALAAAALVAGCGGGDEPEDRAAATPQPAATSESAAVTVKTFIFKPDPIGIEAGETVTWSNQDSAVHTVTSGPRDNPDGSFDHELAESGGTVKQTFVEPGTYEYFCSIHSGPGMEATVVVR